MQCSYTALLIENIIYPFLASFVHFTLILRSGSIFLEPKSRTATAGCSSPTWTRPLVMVMPFLRPAQALLQCIVTILYVKCSGGLTRTNFNLHAALIAPVSTQECSRLMFPCTRLSTDHELCLAFKYPISCTSNVK